ncbi:MAG: metallophosphoesterase [Burkholderiales bacterium]
MKRVRLVAAIVSLTALGFGIWAFAFEPASLVERRQKLAIAHWSAELAGLKVAVLADLHVGSPFNGLDKLGRIVEATNVLQPDLVLIPGDLVIQGVLGGSFVAPERAAAVLARLSAPLGVWATLGNHDWWLDAPRVAAALEQHGIRVLEDKAARIHRGSAHFWLVGISDFWEGPHDLRRAFENVTDDASVLAFTHNPDVFPEIRQRFSLLIAGHTHGGQVYLPFAGRPIVPSKYGQRFAHGHVVEGGRHLYVSPGLGTSILPVRFRVPPEVTLLELHPAQNGKGVATDARK